MWRLFLALCLGTIIGCSSDEATDNNQNVDPSTDTPVDSPTDTTTDNPTDDSVIEPGEHRLALGGALEVFRVGVAVG